MSLLLEPMKFRNGLQATNRIWLAPMTNVQSHTDGTLSEAELHWLTMRAEGGFGVIETCATHVAVDGQAWEGQLGCHHEVMVPGWQRLSVGVHEAGSLVLAQTFHGGMRARRTESGPWSCSASGEGESAVREGSVEDIEHTVEAFAQAARRLALAGVDGVELHGAHGYLLCQFLSSTMNRRLDEWGGSLENRARLMRRVMQATRAVVPSNFVVGVRLSPEDFGATRGLDLDESLQVAQWLCEDGADFIHISLWDASKNTSKRPDVHAARFFRDALPAEVPLVTAGNIWTMGDAMRQLEHGADAVALGRSAIANPAWPRRVAAAGEPPVRPPLTVEQLKERGLSPPFVDYMRRWSGFVAD